MEAQKLRVTDHSVMVDLKHNGDLSTLNSDVVALFFRHFFPLLLLLPLPQFGEDESRDQQPDDDRQHTQGQR